MVRLWYPDLQPMVFARPGASQFQAQELLDLHILTQSVQEQGALDHHLIY